MEIYQSIKNVTKSNGAVKTVKMWEMSKTTFKKFKWISFGLGVAFGVDLTMVVMDRLKKDELKATFEKGVNIGELKGYLDATLDGMKLELEKNDDEVDDIENK